MPTYVCIVHNYVCIECYVCTYIHMSAMKKVLGMQIDICVDNKYEPNLLQKQKKQKNIVPTYVHMYIPSRVLTITPPLTTSTLI